MGHHGSSDSMPARAGLDVKIFEVEPGTAAITSEVGKEDGVGDRLIVE